MKIYLRYSENLKGSLDRNVYLLKRDLLDNKNNKIYKQEKSSLLNNSLFYVGTCIWGKRKKLTFCKSSSWAIIRLSSGSSNPAVVLILIYHLNLFFNNFNFIFIRNFVIFLSK